MLPNAKQLRAHIIGFTGTREGLTSEQEVALRRFLNIAVVYAFHHGDCIGADAEAHAIVRDEKPRTRIFIHPPLDSSLRANCKGAHLICPPAPYMERNRAIVDACELLIATPKTNEEVQRSGTWATIRYARRISKPLILLRPDGTRIG